jgi:hypothetical protein
VNHSSELLNHTGTCNLQLIGEKLASGIRRGAGLWDSVLNLWRLITWIKIATCSWCLRVGKVLSVGNTANIRSVVWVLRNSAFLSHPLQTKLTVNNNEFQVKLGSTEKHFLYWQCSQITKRFLLIISLSYLQKTSSILPKCLIFFIFNTCLYCFIWLKLR